MPLQSEEIEPGVVAILETAPLLNSSEVKHYESGSTFRSGPFLCIQVKGNQSAWLSLTSRRDPRGLRLELKPEWRLEGSDVWRETPQFISDARKPFIGPLNIFVAAGANELIHQPHNRPRVSAECVEAAIKEMGCYKVYAL